MSRKRKQFIHATVALTVGLLLPAASRADSCVDEYGGACREIDGQLSISDGHPRIFFWDEDASQSNWRIETNSYPDLSASYFNIEEEYNGTVFRIDGGARSNSIHVSPSGQVGLGTATPSQELDILDDGGSGYGPAVRFQDNDGQVWELEADNYSLATFDVTANQRAFQVQAGAPSSALFIEVTGNVGVGTHNPADRLHVMGGAIVEGDVSLGSSRQLKHDLLMVETEKVLAELRDLSLYRWRYRGDAQGAQHLGPVAEEFYAAFGLGRDEEHLSPTDVAGVALAAAQELLYRVEALAAENAQLRAEMERLREHLSLRGNSVSDD